MPIMIAAGIPLFAFGPVKWMSSSEGGPVPQIKASPKSYDVVVVGSGAGGGIAAHVLTLAGAKVCMLEAGGDYNTAKQSDMFKWNYDAPHRAAGSKAKPFGYYDATLVGGWQVPGEPYTSAPGSDFMWYRARMLGGRTNHYGRISLRMGPYDFKPYSRDGRGFDWPITYEELAPYYDKAEELIGVFGTHEGLENTPGRALPAGPRAASPHEPHYQEDFGQTEGPLYPLAAGDSHQAAQRPSGLPLLRRVRTFLRRQREFRLSGRPHTACPGYREPGTPHRGHVPRGDGGPRRTCDRGVLHRHQDST